ncbi:Fibulin-2 [Trichoplax sp. H2]|nr:Fibulin-2 [Trichoplax sp. H2]|eukprot:RDD39045.1 Fibulin-2 [Trichoplax sp. H2]
MPGYAGDGYRCQDINECITSNSCSDNADCMNTDGSHICICKQSFHGNGTTFNDVNECLYGNHSCLVVSDCLNKNGSDTCNCYTGYTGNGFVYQDISMSVPSVTNVTPMPTVPTMLDLIIADIKMDILAAGYFSNGSTCTDIKECSSNGHNCPVDAYCNNNNGSYSCLCNIGYSGDGFICEDINECLISKECNPNANCSNTISSYTCQCKQGFSLFSNAIGSYTCTCNNGDDGYGYTCEDVNEYSEKIHIALILTDLITANCINVPGSFNRQSASDYFGDGLNCTKNWYKHRIGYYSDTTVPETQLQSDLHCQRGKVFSGNLRLTRTFKPELNNPSSTAYRVLKQQVTSALTATFNSSMATKENLERLVVTGFRAGSNIMDCYIVFKRNTDISQNQLIGVISSSNLSAYGTKS